MVEHQNKILLRQPKQKQIDKKKRTEKVHKQLTKSVFTKSPPRVGVGEGAGAGAGEGAGVGEGVGVGEGAGAGQCLQAHGGFN